MAVEDEESVKSGKYNCPKPVIVLCIVYGIVLGLHYSLLVAKPLYVTEDLLMGRSMGTFLSHFPSGVRLMGGIIAAVLADSYYGKYKVMATSYVLVFFIPGPLTIISTFHALDLNTRITLYLVGVITDLLVGFGSVVHPAFIAEQFKMPQQEATLETYYMFDYFYYNLCVAILEFVTLEYTFEISCFGGPKCYQILYISYYIVYGIATLLFVIMKRWYIIRMPERSVMTDAVKCIWIAMINRRKSRDASLQVEHSHWLDWADCFDKQWRDDLRRIGKILTMLFPYFVYYFLYSQMNTLWIYQACRLNGRLFNKWTMKPSQVETLNPIVILFFAPIVEYVLNPFFDRIKFLNTPLQRIGFAYILTIFSFIMAATLQIYIDKNNSPMFTDDKAQFRVFNALNCSVHINSSWLTGILEPYEVIQELKIETKDVIYTEMEVMYPNGTIWRGTVEAKGGKGINYVIGNDGLIKLQQELDNTHLASLRPSALLICTYNCAGTFYLKYGHHTSQIYNLEDIQDNAFTITLKCAGTWQFFIDGNFINEFQIGDGGLYGIIIYKQMNNNNKYNIKVNTLIKPNSISIVWIFPQYITITISEIFLYVATNMFVYTQAPPSMRSIVRGLFTAGNSLAQMLLGALSLIRIPEVIWFFSLAFALLIATVIHVIMAKKYKYQIPHD
ncbi:hypothetical protein O3M35_008315 [Rhynocoris fuscipes]|uniref:Uncharacterized protein n=1 Tax=Rhynocoris fuscipes TaxID=488301 RepID=A0AAW1D8H5_9HEMI